MSNYCLQKQKKRYLFLIYLIVVTVILFEYTHQESFGKEPKGELANKTYRRGKSTLTIRVFPDKSGLATKKFNHPYYFKKSTIVDILSSIYYLDKDVMKVMLKKGKTAKRVFQNDEIEKLTPLIIDAFTKATPGEDLLVSSVSERFLLEGLNNVFSLFMTDDKLNIVFGKIRHRGSVSLSSVVKTRRLERDPEPTRIKGSHFWKLVAKPGQRFAPGHKNWLIVDFQNELFVQELEKVRKEDVQKYDKKFKPIVDPLEDRIRKLEEMMVKGDEGQAPKKAEQDAERYTNLNSHQEKKEVSTQKLDTQPDIKEDIGVIREKFYALHELLKEDLITYFDYEEKKLELLISLQEYNVKAGLKELKELKEMELITSDDFENTKAELLKRL